MKYLLLILLSSCTINKQRSVKQSNGEDQSVKESQYEMTCEHIGHAIDRCENREAVCYTSQYQGSESNPNCHIKGEVK